MNEISKDMSINETLNVIRNVLQDDNIDINDKNVLILDQLVKEDGTIKKIKVESINTEEIKVLLNEKLSEVFDLHFEKWLNKNIPNYLEKYFSNKEK